MEIRNAEVLITGANRGIGLAIAKMCAREKAKLHLVMRNEETALIHELELLGAQSVKIWIADLSCKEQVDILLHHLSDTPIEILINNAGLLTGGLLEEQPLEDIYSMFQVNLVSLVHLTRGLLPQMIKQRKGKIVNNSSVSALMHFPCATTYAASKAAVLAFTDCLNIELKGTGVSTLCLITPGIKTRMFDDIEAKYGKNFEVPSDYIDADQYAQLIRKSIKKDDEYLRPSGVTQFGLNVARFLPQLFKWEAGRRFRR